MFAISQLSIVFLSSWLRDNMPRLRKRWHMLSSFKGKAPDKDQKESGGSPVTPPVAPPQRPSTMPAQRPASEQAGVKADPRPEPMSKPVAKMDTVSTIGSSMSIVGQVVCTGQARVYGRVEGELRVSDLLLGDGSQVEGDVVAQEVTVRGHVKGTIRAVKVRLEDGATVTGDIFHRSLSIEENATFEGTSRRVDNPTNAPSGMPEEIPQPIAAPGQKPAAKIDADPQAAAPAATARSAS
jgi:cytoskeletal protein CcmA (bactofilin family)